MPLTSKTGLLPSVTEHIRIVIQTETTLDVASLAVPAPYVLRPFAGVYNPFPYGCSILCNHPADYEAKDVVRKAKDTWASEGRALLASEELSLRSHHLSSRHAEIGEDMVPEELFRRYTDTDSRPITPAPTVASVITRNSQARRCVTPDPIPSLPTRERTLLVLDLRRSHSQDTLSWQGGQDVSRDMVPAGSLLRPPTRASSRTSSMSQSTVLRQKKKPAKRKGTPNNGTPSPTVELPEDKSDKDASQKLQQQVLMSASVKGLAVPESGAEAAGTDGQSLSGDDVVKRRGKKRRGKKAGRETIKEGEREFQGIPDPGETQVSALGNESRAGSTRPSLTPGAAAGDPEPQAGGEARASLRPSNASFLEPEILKQLQRQLDQEVVDAEFDVKRRIALAEALRSRPSTRHVQEAAEMKSLKRELQLPVNHPEKWLFIPRVFTRQSARFELPMDSRKLNTMTPVQYAQNFVFASSERLVLYNHVFNRHREELDEDEEEAKREILGKNVVVGLGEIMGRSMTDKEASDLQQLLGWTDDMSLDFRSFVGVGALCERLLGPQFCSKMASQEEDPRHEVEQADFESLDRKLLYLKPDPRIVFILKGIRDT